MTLDAYPGDAAILRRAAEQEARRTGIALGPDSPLREDANRPTHPSREKGRKTRQEEHAIQVALFANLNDMGEQRRRPELAMAFAVPNGGQRRPAVAAKLKAGGVKPGVLDVWLPVARAGYHGLVVELKTPHGSISPEQAHWIAALERQGWKVAVHVSAFDAFAEFTHYLDSPEPLRK